VRGPLEEILFGPGRSADGTTNIIGALRRAMATTGYSDVKEFQRVEVVVSPYRTMTRSGARRHSLPPHDRVTLDAAETPAVCRAAGPLCVASPAGSSAPAAERSVTTSPMTGGPNSRSFRCRHPTTSGSPRPAVAQRDAAGQSCRIAARAGSWRLHDLVLDRQEELLDLIQLESGKARLHAFEEVADVAIVCTHYAATARHTWPRRTRGAFPVLTRTGPHTCPDRGGGVVSPWNYPLTLPHH
jgi:succinate-semialdehyde dehydrogenase/glutarate-semialdehyde dehydrogenase